mmetsp:Transcript_114756/g.222908  ORF Transcript_114756/g.222908 Transcript_114756/m.222908 type:complete len:141 (+) Transcript_114756:126-548(+)
MLRHRSISPLLLHAFKFIAVIVLSSLYTYCQDWPTCVDEVVSPTLCSLLYQHGQPAALAKSSRQICKCALRHGKGDEVEPVVWTANFPALAAIVNLQRALSNASSRDLDESARPRSIETRSRTQRTNDNALAAALHGSAE